MKDLVALVADKNIQFSLHGLLSRPGELGIRAISREILVHPRRDPGVRIGCHDFLRPFLRRSHYALVVLDLEGSGHPGSREELETDIESRLSRNGWENRCAAVVIQPELESWLWANSTDVDDSLGWPCDGVELRTWLAEQGCLAPGEQKPRRPKEAVEAALRRSGKKRSSSLYGDLAARVDFRMCADPAFRKLRATLQTWFSLDAGASD